MPKNKSAKPNAFILFVMERKKQLEQDGEQFSGLSDAVEKLGPEWKIMSKQHREPFEQKAKAKKAEILEKEQKRRVQISAPVYGFTHNYVPTSSGQVPRGGYPG